MQRLRRSVQLTTVMLLLVGCGLDGLGGTVHSKDIWMKGDIQLFEVCIESVDYEHIVCSYVEGEQWLAAEVGDKFYIRSIRRIVIR